MNLKQIFPKGSEGFFKANLSRSEFREGTIPPIEKKNAVQGIVATRRGHMNRVESEYALILEAQKRAGEINRWEFEGITLRFQGVKYTPDFFVTKIERYYEPDAEIHLIKFIEIKGNYIKGKFERAIERFRHARTYYPEFVFEMHQKTKEGWKQIL